MKCDLSLRKRREIARAVLEGLHGFQYSWPERAEVYEALDAIAQANDPRFVMLNGHGGVGISSILEAFASKYNDQVIVVRPRIYMKRLNIIGQVLHAVFPFSEFRSHKRVPDSLISFRKAARKIIIFDDLDIISNQNNMREVVFDQLARFLKYPGCFTVIMSTRNRKLIRDYFAIKHLPTTMLPVSGIIPASSIKNVVHAFFEWCNRLYDTDVQPPCVACPGKREADMPIDCIVFECESLYCAELLEVLTTFKGEGRDVGGEPSLSISYESISQIRHAAECYAFD